LKKRSKKLLDGCRGLAGSARQAEKVFWFFFSKKNSFLPPAQNPEPVERGTKQ
jgi:hypothetical protein